MKNKAVLILFFLAGAVSYAQEGMDLLMRHYAEWSYAPGEVPENDIDRIVMAGLRAPSTNNRQPWFLTVVRTPALAKKIVKANVDGNVLIVVSSFGDEESIYRQTLDCGLAIESIYLAAQALGYGSRIYTGPIDYINKSLVSELGLPEGYRAVALVRIGFLHPSVDALSGASERKDPAALVNYR